MIGTPFRNASFARRLPPAQAYETLAPHYDRIANPMIALEQDAMSALLPALRELTVADLGCGTGRSVARALSAGARRVVALDLSGGMLAELGRRYAGDERVAAIRGDLQELPLTSGSVDGVVSGLALGYAPRLDRAVAEIARVIKPGGFALLSDLHPIGPRLGWKREYRIGSNGHRETIEVDHFPYSFEHLFELAFDSGLFLESLHEAPVGRSLGRFARGFRGRLRLRRLRDVPAVAVFLFKKEE